MRARYIPRGVALVFPTLLVLLLAPMAAVRATEPFADPAFRALWDRTDGPVAASAVQRTFLWGPSPIGGAVQEKYAQSPGGMRLVQYFDKSRMEITQPGATQGSAFYVTNGLLVVELMTGRVQMGNDPVQIELRDPANINAAGDGDDSNAPTYQTLAKLRDLPARALDTPIKESVDRGGKVSTGGMDGVATVVLVPETRHAVASVFWTFMNSSGPVSDGAGNTATGPLFANPFYATGYPVTEAYWTTVKVAGAARQVLMQAFERRVLTYTPGNPAGFEVEAGNVGAHYYQWRYQSKPSTIVDPTVAIGPIPQASVFSGKYNLTPADVPDRFLFQLDGEASNSLIAKNDPDPNYGTYLKQWQRLTGYRRVFVRNDVGSQASAIQSLVSVFRTADGAYAALNFNHDRFRNQPSTVVTDGVFGTNSYLVTDRSTEGITVFSLVWQQGNVLTSIDVNTPTRGGLTAVDIQDLAAKVGRRLAADLSAS
ncbi:MAG: hypothetical protein M3Z19_00185 [Chloroflexota bacterium]|nr:hypothetical protein [Chloroflexota bacterium]